MREAACCRESYCTCAGSSGFGAGGLLVRLLVEVWLSYDLMPPTSTARQQQGSSVTVGM